MKVYLITTNEGGEHVSGTRYKVELLAQYWREQFDDKSVRVIECDESDEDVSEVRDVGDITNDDDGYSYWVNRVDLDDYPWIKRHSEIK